MSDAPPAESNDRLASDFLDFIVCMNEQMVEFVLVGGYAVGIHGVVRATGDIDFFYRRTEENVQRLCAALAAFGAPPNVVSSDTLMTPDMVTYFGEPPYRIDLLGDVDGVSFDEVWAGSAHFEIEGQQVRVIGLAELRRNKAATGRKKDRQDLRELRQGDDGTSASPVKRRSRKSVPPGSGRTGRRQEGNATRKAYTSRRKRHNRGD